MTHVAHTVHVVFGGHINTVQTWSFGVWFTYSGTPTPSSADLAADLAVNGDVHGFEDDLISSLRGTCPDQLTFDNIRYSVYGADPTVPAESMRQTMTPVVGAATFHLPPEAAVVASLHTGVPGASFRGRSYLPLCGLVLDDSGLIPDTTAVGIASHFAAYLSAMNGHTFAGGLGGDLGYGVNAVVFSNTKSVATSVIAVSVDTRVDSQRRREHKLPGVVHTSVVTGH